MADGTDKARDEFFSEAQELVETFSRNLLALDAAQRAGAVDPSLVNETFRAIHTLKGLSGLFGAKRMSQLSHRLEDVLDSLRLGRLELSADLLDVLFTAVELYGAILAAEKERSDAPIPSLTALLSRMEHLGTSAPTPANALAEFELDAGILAVLTEYEEHRLRTNVEQGLSLYRVRVQFELSTIDKALEEIKTKARPLGEVITYLPTGEATGADSIELDLLLASAARLDKLEEALGADNVRIEEIPRRKGRPSLVPQETAPPVVPAASVRSAAMAAEASDPGLVSERPVTDAPEQMQLIRAVTQTVRVDIRKLDALMNVVGELAIVKGALARMVERLRAEGNRPLGSELHRLHRSFDRRLSELQSGILEVRMVPLGQVFDRLARVVRQISREMNKDIRLVITGAETEIDKLIVEELSDPLMHIVRNAIDHGIELQDEREQIGKPVAGTIALNAFQKGNHVVIEVEDDGRGINEELLVQRAVSMGKIEADAVRELSRNEVLGLIFLPGLSTRSEAGDYSGRGVGMDVVKTNISKLGGVIDVHSETQIGTKLTITLPVTLAIVSALLIRVAGRTFAMPLTSVAEAIAFDEAQVRTVDGREVMTLRGATLPICRLSRLFGLKEAAETPRRRYVVVATLGVRRLGFTVDHLMGQQDIVIKSLGQSLASVRGFSGATELGDQRVALVLDPASLIEEMLSSEIKREGRFLHG